MPDATQDQARDGLAEFLRAREANSQQAQEKKVQELVTKIQEARQEIDFAAEKLHHAAMELTREARKARNDATSSHLMYASAHSRLAGVLNQGVRRTASMDRFLDRAAAVREEDQRRDQQEKEQREIRARGREVQKAKLPTSDDFDELYGEVTSAV